MSAPLYMTGYKSGRMTAAQSREQEQQAVNATMMLEGASCLGFADLCDAFVAIMEARPDINHDRLQSLGNSFCRLADNIEREARNG